MLFDLRGRGRRRTIQGIYLFLAVLMGGGLIFFGVGGTGVGLFNSDNNNGSGGTVSNDALKKAEKSVRRRPNDPKAWAELTRTRFQSADYDSTKQLFTNAKQLQGVSNAYKRYRVLLHNGKPDVAILQQMVQVYGESGLQQYSAAVPVVEDVTAIRPSVTGYEQLAIYAKVAGQTRKADLAQQKAITLAEQQADTPKAKKQAPKSVKSVIKQQVGLIQQVQQQEAQSAGGSSSGG